MPSDIEEIVWSLECNRIARLATVNILKLTNYFIVNRERCVVQCTSTVRGATPRYPTRRLHRRLRQRLSAQDYRLSLHAGIVEHNGNISTSSILRTVRQSFSPSFDQRGQDVEGRCTSGEDPCHRILWTANASQGSRNLTSLRLESL